MNPKGEKFRAQLIEQILEFETRALKKYSLKHLMRERDKRITREINELVNTELEKE